MPPTPDPQCHGAIVRRRCPARASSFHCRILPMPAPVDHYSHSVELAAEALLRAHPDALVCGLANDGLIVPVPKSMGLWGQAAIEGRAVIDLVLAEDRMTVIEAWFRAKKESVAEGKVRLLSKPSQWMTLHFLDLRAAHGVLLCALKPSDEGPAEARNGDAEEVAPAAPRFCTLTEDETGVVLDVDEAFTQMLGYTAEEVIGKPVLDQVHPDDRARSVEGWIAMLSTRRIQQMRLRRRRADGSWIWLDSTVHNFLNQPDRNYVLVELVDVSAEMAAQEALQQQGELLRRLTDAMPDGLLQLDTDRNVVYNNARLLEILQGSPERASAEAEFADMSGSRETGALRPMGAVLHTLTEEGMATFETALGHVLERGDDRDVEVDVTLPSAEPRRVLMSIRALLRGDGAVSGTITTALDITDSARARRELEKRATFDALTGCHNRSSILAALRSELAREDSTCTGVLYVDLDNFKSVNDTLGHAAGDESLTIVAERLRVADRDDDEIGRLGGDEFLLLLRGIPGPEVAMGVAQRVCGSLRTSARLSSGTVELRASVGVACTQDEAIDAEELISRADAAMYRSKEQAKGLPVLATGPSDDGLRGSGRKGHRHAPVRSTRDGRGQLEEIASEGGDAMTRGEVEQRLAQHTRQHEAVAHLGQVALREPELDTLIDEVVATVAGTLDVDASGVLKLREDEELLDVLAKVGLEGPDRGLPAGTGTHSGYALKTQRPVVVEDLHLETRFDPTLLLDKGFVSAMNAPIEGHERSFGVLSALSARPRRFSADDVNFLVAVANVLSAAVERQRKEEAARHAALHDPLTGLSNRTLALDHIDRALARRRRDGAGVAVLVLDLDRLKIINDSLGHAAGDQVLVALASRLQETLRQSDTIARLGGDEFVVVCEGPDEVRHVTELAQRIGDALARPLLSAGGEHFLTASIGMAVAERPEDTAASLLRDADAAMHRAKKLGPGRHELFDASVRAQVLSRLHTETELRQALEHEQLQVYYQPIIDTATGRPVATEALVRWQHPDHGLIPPLEFIPIAEETGLIVELGRYVLEHACKQGAAWQRQFAAPLEMFVNVSAHQLANQLFPAEVAEVARRRGLLAGTLGLEVTESVLIGEAGSSATVLNELDAYGLRLMLDDFGTGYSSLSYLRRFPLGGVKVDRSFIDGLGDNPEDAAIMKAIVEMCRALGLTVVAEGVETDAQLRQLRQLGCERVQGYLLCHPKPPEEITELLDERLVTFSDAQGSTGAHLETANAGVVGPSLLQPTVGSLRN
jgi:diguanylate cyclase (GGDEF)-like protein/PAS domain S-box-containing protein